MSSEFIWPVRVYYEDTDSAGVVYYANYLRFMERARSEWLRSLGFEQDQLRDREGIIFAVRSAQLDFLRPARFNDLLQVSARILRAQRVSLRIEQQVFRDGMRDDVLCRGIIRIACLDAQHKRPCPMPTTVFAEIAHVC